MNLISIAAATILIMASLNEAAPTTAAKAKQAAAGRLPGLENIKHVVYFMQVKNISYTCHINY
jgi:phospholipase C